MPARLARLLREFARTEPVRACSEPAGAYANCLALSARCAEWLRSQGVECGLLRHAGSLSGFPQGAGRWPLHDPRTIGHWTVRAGPWSVDWTARQFRPQADWPEVERVDALGARWSLTEVWACERCRELVAHPLHRELAPAWLEQAHLEVARATGGAGPFADPRHDATGELVSLCTCPSPSVVDGLEVRERPGDVGAALALPVPGAAAAAEGSLQSDVVAAAVDG